MMKINKTVFTGAATALITPFFADGSIDYENLAKLIDSQIDAGIDALVICGTTGESATMTLEEHHDVIRYSVKKAAGRVPIVAGAGSNDTACAIETTAVACDAGADAVLLVTPYYNKCTQKGLIRSFTAIADSSSVPVILYNVPSRTGVSIEPATYAVLADHPMISGIKEANGNIAKIVETMSLVGDKLDMYSGNDDQIVPILSVGGKGVISVLSNILPAETHELCRKWFDGDIKGAAEDQFKYTPLIKALFSEVNPIPVKAACAAMGFCANSVRLPLTPMEPEHEAVLLSEMRKVGIAV